MRLTETLRSLDWTIIITASLLVAIGLAMIFSAAYDTQGIFASLFVRQSAAALLGVLTMFAVARVPYIWWRRHAWLLYGLGVASLVYVGIAAQIIRGTASRLNIAGIQIQPSEFVKVTLVVVLAYLLARSRELGYKALTISFAVIALPVGLILLEPDLGMAVLLLSVWVVFIIFLGFSWSKITLLGVAGLLLAVVGGQWFLADYQRERLLTFLDPGRDPLGAGYNITQSIVALGSGQLFGRGLGHGPQSRLQFLPEQHTDFIFASIGEELGFIGVAVVIILYTILLVRVLLVVQRTKDQFARLLAVGAFTVLLVGFSVNAGMNIGLLPVTGIPLPLISYGGSNLLSSFILLGLVQSVVIRSRWTQAPPGEIDCLT